MGWRGSKAKRSRSYPRADLLPYRDPEEPREADDPEG